MSELSAESRRGGCLCGAVIVEVSGPLRDIYNCHCHRCRRFTGHHMAATQASTADIVIRDDRATLRWYHPVPEAGYGFCSECGSSLFWRSTQTPERLSICAGVLEPPTGLRTAAAWWTSQASDYHTRPAVPELSTE